MKCGNRTQQRWQTPLKVLLILQFIFYALATKVQSSLGAWLIPLQPSISLVLLSSLHYNRKTRRFEHIKKCQCLGIYSQFHRLQFPLAPHTQRCQSSRVIDSN
jgi:hypothetical protein